MTNDEYIYALLQKHYDEAHCGMVDKAPSLLKRGEASTANYYIFKIDICRSTALLSKKTKGTYHKLAHIFLSTIDKITRDHGADSKQVEYAGDGLTAYFSAVAGAEENVLRAAAFCDKAARDISSLDQTLRSIRFKTKTVIHYAELTLANIGPWGDSRLSAIGYPLHEVSKIEKGIGEGIGRVTIEYAKQLHPKQRLHYLRPVYTESAPITTVMNPQPAASPHSAKSFADFLRMGTQTPPPLSTIMNPQPAALPHSAKALADALRAGSQVSIDSLSQIKPERTLVGYDIKWNKLHGDIFG